MLSRRSVRVKVMQQFFAMSRDETVQRADIKRMYRESVDASYKLFLYSLYNIMQIAKVSEEDETRRKAKHLPTEEDKVFTAKLYYNPVIQSLFDNKLLRNSFQDNKFDIQADSDFHKKVYFEFAKENDPYKKYISKDTAVEDDIEILLELFRYCRRNEYFNEVMEDKYINWVDDKSLVVGVIKKMIKAQPDGPEDLFTTFVPDDETAYEFGEQLLLKTFDEDEKLLSHIMPLLQNWDHERVAVLDLILLKMATTEFLNFETIPGRVTINEFVDIAKQYSTAKSKEFINGVLDSIMKTFEKEGLLVGGV